MKSTVLGCLALRATTCCSKGVYLMPVVGFLLPGILVIDECLEPFEGFSSVVFVDTASADSISQSDSWVMFSSVLLQISKSSGPLVWNFIFRSSRSTSLFWEQLAEKLSNLERVISPMPRFTLCLGLHFDFLMSLACRVVGHFDDVADVFRFLLFFTKSSFSYKRRKIGKKW